jgi:cell pole-organizing protein PopZ
MDDDTKGPMMTGRRRDENDASSTGLADKTHEVAEHARSAALGQISAAQDAADAAKKRAADRMRTWGTTVRKVGEHLRVEEQHYVADRAERASRQIDELASYVSSAELGKLLRDGEDIARRNPLAFFGGAFVAGLAAGRLFKGASALARSHGPSERERAGYTRRARAESSQLGQRATDPAPQPAGSAGGASQPAGSVGNGGGDKPQQSWRLEERGAGR